MYRVTYGDMHIAKEKAKMCYAFLNMKILYNTEVQIVSKNAQAKLMPGRMESENMYVAEYTAENIPAFSEFWEIYRKNRVGVMCLASFDAEGKERVGMTFMPETYDINLAPEAQIVISTYSPESDAKMDYFLADLYHTYDEIK